MTMFEIIHNEVSDYEDNYYAIESIFFDSVLEADSVEQLSDNDNIAMSRKIRDKIDKLIKTLLGIIDRGFLKISNILTNFLQTDEGFKKSCRTQMTKVKPLEAVKLVAYEYNDVFLETQINKLSLVIVKLLQKIDMSQAESETEMLLPPNELIAKVLTSASGNSSITNINLYFGFLKDGYRHKKSEQLFKASETRKYYTKALGSGETKSDVAQRKKMLHQQIGRIRNVLNQSANDIGNDKSQLSLKQSLLKQSSNATHLFNLYVSVLNMYTQLKIEMHMQYRAVMKKLYQF